MTAPIMRIFLLLDLAKIFILKKMRAEKLPSSQKEVAFFEHKIFQKIFKIHPPPKKLKFSKFEFLKKIRLRFFQKVNFWKL